MSEQNTATFTQTQHRPMCVIVRGCVAVGDCLTCDGYVLDTREAPYCPTCARERKRVGL
jgi:hypothetical protein